MDLPDPVFLGTGQFDPNYTGLQVRYDIAGDRTIVQFSSADNNPFPLGMNKTPSLEGEIELVGRYNLTASDFNL